MTPQQSHIQSLQLTHQLEVQDLRSGISFIHLCSAAQILHYTTNNCKHVHKYTQLDCVEVYTGSNCLQAYIYSFYNSGD